VQAGTAGYRIRKDRETWQYANKGNTKTTKKKIIMLMKLTKERH